MIHNNTFRADEARRLALYAQGFGAGNDSAASGRSEAEGIRGTLKHLGLLQIDTINYFARSHYVPVYSRFGTYAMDAFDAQVFNMPDPRSGAEFIEYRSHELAIMPSEDYPMWKWRMASYASASSNAGSWAREHPKVIQRVKELLVEHGPMTAGQMAEHKKHEGTVPYWSTNRTMEKQALEVLFHTGEVVSAGRDRFQRRYGLAEQVLPSAILNAPEPTEFTAIRTLVERAVRHLGIGTAADIRDYFRIRNNQLVLRALAELTEEGSVVEVRVPEWGKDEASWADAALLAHPELPQILASTPSNDVLLNPFDPLVWFRPRAERIFEFSYRIEIYVPEAKRQYGYYCLPVLLDERIVGRFDVKANRKTKELEVRASWAEPNHLPADTERIATLMRQAAAWQGLERIVVLPQGNLARELATALK